MFITAFPPIAPLDGQVSQMDTVEQYERRRILLLRTIDQHIGASHHRHGVLSAVAASPHPVGI